MALKLFLHSWTEFIFKKLLLHASRFNLKMDFYKTTYFNKAFVDIRLHPHATMPPRAILCDNLKSIRVHTAHYSET